MNLRHRSAHVAGIVLVLGALVSCSEEPENDNDARMDAYVDMVVQSFSYTDAEELGVVDEGDLPDLGRRACAVISEAGLEPGTSMGIRHPELSETLSTENPELSQGLVAAIIDAASLKLC
jgi:hypothetical protein